ncbi:hypothetical protein HDV00_003332 [Rhizophlyctis rosea]|nr:hypothetical protein HDV00_003332 [Rhizophlyctis rosea]
MSAQPSNPNPSPNDTWAAHAKKAIEHDDSSSSPQSTQSPSTSDNTSSNNSSSSSSSTTDQALHAASFGAKIVASDIQGRAEAALETTADKLQSALASAEETSSRIASETTKAVSAAVGDTRTSGERAKEELEQLLRQEQGQQRAETLKPVVEFFNQGKDPEMERAEGEKELLERLD